MLIINLHYSVMEFAGQCPCLLDLPRTMEMVQRAEASLQFH